MERNEGKEWEERIGRNVLIMRGKKGWEERMGRKAGERNERNRWKKNTRERH